MKLLKLLIPVLILSGCSSKQGSTITSESIELSYSMVEDKHINWSSVFEIQSSDYFVYIYSSTCGHCGEIKELVISYALSHDNFFFITYSNEIPVIQDKESVIGKTKVEDIGVAGTPELFRIESHVLTENIVGSKAIFETLTNDV